MKHYACWSGGSTAASSHKMPTALCSDRRKRVVRLDINRADTVQYFTKRRSAIKVSEGRKEGSDNMTVLAGCLSRHAESLRAGRSGDRTPGGEKISAPVQASSGAHPASYTMGTVLFPGGKVAVEL
jgi:hypothetical protein